MTQQGAWRRRLEGRALEHGLVSVIKNTPPGNVIRMLRSTPESEHLEADLISGSSATLRMMRSVAESCARSLEEVMGWRIAERSAYADQHVRRATARGFVHANLDLRISRTEGWLWCEVKWGDLEHHRAKRHAELEKLQLIARAADSWQLVLPTGRVQPLERPAKVCYLIVSPAGEKTFAWELYTCGVYGQVYSCQCTASSTCDFDFKGGSLRVEEAQPTPAAAARLSELKVPTFVRARGQVSVAQGRPRVLRGYEVVEIPRSGLCLYDALARGRRALHSDTGNPRVGSLRAAEQLRSDLMGWLLQHPRCMTAAQSPLDFASVIAHEYGETVEQYARASRSGRYGGEVELLLFVRKFRIGYVVCQKIGGAPQILSEQKIGGAAQIALLFEPDSSDEMRNHYQLLIEAPGAPAASATQSRAKQVPVQKVILKQPARTTKANPGKKAPEVKTPKSRADIDREKHMKNRAQRLKNMKARYAATKTNKTTTKKTTKARAEVNSANYAKNQPRLLKNRTARYAATKTNKTTTKKTKKARAEVNSANYAKNRPKILKQKKANYARKTAATSATTKKTTASSSS